MLFQRTSTEKLDGSELIFSKRYPKTIFKDNFGDLVTRDRSQLDVVYKAKLSDHGIIFGSWIIERTFTKLADKVIEVGSQGLHGIQHDLAILDLRTKGKLSNGKGKKGVNYKLENNIIVFADKKGRSLAGTKHEGKDTEFRIASLERDRLVLIVGSEVGSRLELTYRSMAEH